MYSKYEVNAGIQLCGAFEGGGGRGTHARCRFSKRIVLPHHATTTSSVYTGEGRDMDWGGRVPSLTPSSPAYFDPPPPPFHKGGGEVQNFNFNVTTPPSP